MSEREVSNHAKRQQIHIDKCLFTGLGDSKNGRVS